MLGIGRRSYLALAHAGEYDFMEHLQRYRYNEPAQSKKKQRLIAETCRETTQRLCPNPVWAFFQACLNIGKYPKIEWFIIIFAAIKLLF